MGYWRKYAESFLVGLAGATLLGAAKASFEPKGQRMSAMRSVLTTKIPKAAVVCAAPCAVLTFALMKWHESVRNKRTNKDKGNNHRSLLT